MWFESRVGIDMMTDEEMEIRTFDIKKEDAGERIDKYLAAAAPDLSRSYIQKLAADGLITQHHTGAVLKANYRLKAGDILAVRIPQPESLDILPENIPLDILYEDDDILIVNKPKGMVVHPAPGHYSGTLVNAVMYHCGDHLSSINGVLRPGIVHRIDRDTSGVLAICKNDAAHRSLAAQLEVHSITRAYRAIVYHNIKEDNGTVNAPIGRMDNDRKKMCVNPRHGRNAVTHYKVLRRFGKYTYIECRLETGRTHQIRVHMASIHHPILGDVVYGPSKDKFSLNGQALHAMLLGFIHPTRGEYVEFTAPLPDYFQKLLQELASV